MRGFLAACCALLAACTTSPDTKVATGGHILLESRDSRIPPPLPAAQSVLIDQGYYPVLAGDPTDGIVGTLRPVGVPEPTAALAPIDEPMAAPADDAPTVTNDIAYVQVMLDEMGFAPGPIDGIDGPLTQAAIQSFQVRHRHAPGGDIGIIAAQLEAARLVPEAQQLLTELGYVPGPIDGIPGPLTHAAMTAFQMRYGIEATGDVTEESLTVLRSVATLREIQIRLAGLGYDPGPADGILGPRTKKAILFFERDRELPHVGWSASVVRERLREAPYIEETQRLLTALGYDPGPVTGRDSEQTRTAIRAFQLDSNVPSTGRASADLLLMIHNQAQAKLSPAAGPSNDAPLPPADRANAVDRAAQNPVLTRLLPLAEEGAPSAQHLVAGIYMRGQGVAASLPVAIDWYEQAANQGFAPAQHRLGLIYAFGIGIDSDPSAARAWLTQAAANGHPAAAKALAMLSDETPPDTADFLR